MYFFNNKHILKKNRLANIGNYLVNHPKNVIRGSYDTLEVFFVLLLAYGSYNLFTSDAPDGFLLGCILAYMSLTKGLNEVKLHRLRNQPV